MHLVRDTSDPAIHADQVKPAAVETPETVLRPPTGWKLINFRELWQFRDLLYFLTWRDVKIRYKQTILGASWAVLQPALMMVVFTVFFGRLVEVETGGMPYAVFVYAGLLPWTFFATAIANGGNSVVGSERLITKIYFPRLAIPFASIGAAIVDFVVACSVLVLLMFYYGVTPDWRILLLPPLFLLLLMAATGVGTLLAALNVAYRDFRYVIPFMVQLWMFATPSIYLDITRLPEDKLNSTLMQTLLIINPLTDLIAGFRAALLGTSMDWRILFDAAPMCVGIFLVGCFYFRRVEDNFADII